MAKLVGGRETDTSWLRLMSLDPKIFNDGDFGNRTATVTKSKVELHYDDSTDEDGEFVEDSQTQDYTYFGNFAFDKSSDGKVSSLSGKVTAIDGHYSYDDFEETRSYGFKLTDLRITVRDILSLDKEEVVGPANAALMALIFKGADTMIGSTYGDRLLGYAGADLLIGGGGADELDGGAGSDTASYENAARSVSAYLGKARLNQGDAKGDTYASIENLKGSKFGDTLYGDAAANKVMGGAGDDRIGGRDGRDTIETGSGRDAIVFNSALNAKKNVDTVTDFSHRFDTFELDDAFFKGLKVGMLGADAFHIGIEAANGEDRIIYDGKNGNVYFDRDGSADKYGAVKFAVVRGGTTLDHTDFLVI